MAALRRQTTGSVVCPSCGRLVGVNDEECLNCGRKRPGMWGLLPAIQKLGTDLGFVPFVIGSCTVLYVLSLLLAPSQIDMRLGLTFLSPSLEAAYSLGASGTLPVFRGGQWWSVLSAGWLHGGLLHIGFNMYWVSQLGPAMARIYGPARAAILYIGSSVIGFAITSVAPFIPLLPFASAGFTLGASAAIFGWLGALIHYSRRAGGAQMTQQLLGFALPLFVFGLLMPGVDNWAHIGGFLGGYLLSKWLDPLQPERGDHGAWALAGIAASALAVLASLLKYYGLF